MTKAVKVQKEEVLFDTDSGEAIGLDNLLSTWEDLIEEEVDSSLETLEKRVVERF